MQPTSQVVMFPAKSEKFFQDAIVAEQVPCFQLGFGFLKVENSDDFNESQGQVAAKNKKSLLTKQEQKEIHFCWKHKQKLRRAKQIEC